MLQADPELTRATESHGWTPLHVAVKTGDAGLVAVLLAFGGEVDAKDVKGWTPLHWAAAGGHAGIARLLLAHGANASAASGQGKTPEHVAQQALDGCAQSRLMSMIADKYREVLVVLRATNLSVSEVPQKEARGGSPTDRQESSTDSPDARFPDLDDADGLKRAECAIRLGKQKNEDAVDKLIAVLRSEGTLLGQAALSQALGRIGDRRALPVLRETLRALRDKPSLKFVLVAWSTSVTQANALPESFIDLDDDVYHMYSHEQSALQADAGSARQIHEWLVGVSRREYVFRSVLMSVAQLGERVDLAEIIPFLTWTWEEHAFLEPYTSAADALTILLDKLPIDESLYDELRQLETSVLRSKEHAAKQGWHTEEHTDKALAAISRKHHAIRKQMRAQARTPAAQENSKRKWWEFWK